ncbi:AAA family ATPase [Streptomyces fuscichromogenes]|uniref:AAA family ATPase n=1 Tax=Streptomyces fuscichromogenes TaxID=1324013 RepID=UPI00381D2CF9
MHPTHECLLGRERESDHIHGCLSDPDGPRLMLVWGERGVGRSTFLRAVGDRLGAQGTAVLEVGCVRADAERPLLLALRLVMALEKRWSAAQRQQSAGQPVAQALSAVDRRDRTAMQALLRATLSHSAPAVVLVDDAQYADPESLTVLGAIDFPRLTPGIRLVVSAARHVERSEGRAGGDALPQEPEVMRDVDGGSTARAHRAEWKERAPACDDPGGAVERLAGAEGARTVDLPRLAPEDVTALVERWLQAAPDAALARRVHECTRGNPGAVDALLTGWTRRGEIRVADGRAFLNSETPIPVLPDDNRFVTALDVLGEPCRAVATALSVLWPLGRSALELIAASAGFSADAVVDGVRGLVAAGIIDELPSPDGSAVRGWTFRLPLTAHTVRERLRPMERSRLSALAVEALWADADAARAGQPPGPAACLLDEADARTYLADRIADAGTLVDRDRGVAELMATAEWGLHGTQDGGMLRWFRAAAALIEQPTARDPALQRYATATYLAGDHQTGRMIGEALLRNPGTLNSMDLQGVACLLVTATAIETDWRTVSRLATARWWEELPVPALAKVSGQALALCHLSRWQEALELLSHTEPAWDTDPQARAVPRCFRGLAELALGRPEAYRRQLAMPEASKLRPDQVYSLAGGLFDDLAVGYDLSSAEALLKSLGLTVEVLLPLSRFLWYHLTGRWDEALDLGRRMLANNEIVTIPVSDSSVLPARTAAILLARGRTTSALNVVEGMRGPEDGPPQCSMDAAEAEVLRTLGDLEGSEKTLRRGLDRAQVHAQIYGTEELWALLTEVTAEAGRTAEAVACLERLERIADRMGSDRTRLRYLLASARIVGQDAPETVRGNLREAVDLARSRGLPWETAATLVAAAEAGAGPTTLLHEAYELLGVSDAVLWRFHTRTAMRQAGLTVPGRKQATAENERLLATLIAEGLTNRRIATVLRLSEDAVAQRLSRLFARTGLRSRTEVVTAVHTGSL